MDKRNKIIIVVCVVIIVVAIGIATSVAVIKNSKKPLDIDNNNTVNLDNEQKEPILDYNDNNDINEVTDDELDNLLQ